MIEELLKRNNISLPKRVIERIKNDMDAEELNNTINYLTCRLRISASAIEKCPDVLRKLWEDIEDNLDYLTVKRVEDCDHDTLLPILSVPITQLEETYQYVFDVYGEEAIKRTPIILKASKKRIQEVEAVVSGYPVETLFQIACSKHGTDEIKRIIDMCESQNIPITRVLLNRTAKEIKGIQDFCVKYHLPLKEAFFFKHPNELENTAQFIKDEYGEDYITPTIVLYDKGHIQRTFAYIRGKRCLECIKKDPSILRLSLDEIIDREIVIRERGEGFTTLNEEREEVFHPMFAKSRKEFLEEKKKKGSQK